MVGYFKLNLKVSDFNLPSYPIYVFVNSIILGAITATNFLNIFHFLYSLFFFSILSFPPFLFNLCYIFHMSSYDRWIYLRTHLNFLPNETSASCSLLPHSLGLLQPITLITTIIFVLSSKISPELREQSEAHVHLPFYHKLFIVIFSYVPFLKLHDRYVFINLQALYKYHIILHESFTSLNFK